MNAFAILWEKTLAYLEEDISRFDFDVWIKQLEPLMQIGNAYYFKVTSPMHKKFMVEKYESKIYFVMRMAYEELYGVADSNFTLAFVTPQEAELIEKEAERAQSDSEATVQSKYATLNPNHTFDSFVVGDSNKFANAAALAVSSAPGKAYNPLFLYGGVGLGKTHLMHAIGNRILEKNPSLDIFYVTSETFTNELINMIGHTNNNANIDMREQFRNKYRKVDVLMIDDIQFIAGKRQTEDEFFHTFNALHELNKQIILSSDRPPKEMKDLEERMRSRFEWGLIADIKPPDYETRVAILIKKSQVMFDENMLPVRDDVYHYIASHDSASIRTLEGALRKVMMHAELHKEEENITEIDVPLAEKALVDYFSNPSAHAITPKLVVDNICKYYDISEDDIRGQKKVKDYAFPRQVAMYILREKTDLSHTKIAEFFGKKDHTTIMYAEKKIKEQIKKDSSLKREIDDILSMIKE